jgi:hypothetical protein
MSPFEWLSDVRETKIELIWKLGKQAHASACIKYVSARHIGLQMNGATQFKLMALTKYG